ncbi:MAG TPA: phenylacetate--CoA ligase family protein [Lachnospiraceae bacterium]|nr:phenylacetate--CoA ligase family protein [Lachnospiraceae bacterium]
MQKGRKEFMEAARWSAFFALDSLKKSGMKEMYEKDADAWRFGTSEAETEEKIRKVLEHARTTCPFYRNIREGAVLQDFPVVNKETIRSHYDDFLSPDFAKAKGTRQQSTSGSTGTPITIYQDLYKANHDQADGIFLGALAGYYIGQKMAFVRVWVHNIVKSRLELLAENFIMMDGSHLDDVSIADMLETIRRKHVKCIIGYSSALTEFCRYLESNEPDMSGFEVSSIIPISESMLPEVRKKLSEMFDCPVRSWYSDEECGIMGVQEKDSERYYINSESYHYEILKPDSDEAAEEGEVGRIVITDLNNYAMPLIRYDTGDLAKAEKVEKDGRYKFYLTELYGRRGDMLYDTQGRIMTPMVISLNLWDVKGIRQYQFIQTGEKEYELHLNADPEAVDLSMITGRLQPYFGTDAVLKAEFVDEIPVLSSGKRKYTLNTYRK